MLSTDWSRAIGIDVPIVNAPMGGVAGGALAAAVSRAGGLGMIGMGSAGTAERLDAELGHVSNLARPFGIGLVEWVAIRQPDLLATALAANPALLCVSFGETGDWVRRAHDAGVVAATQVSDLDSAERAVAAGVDVVIARGAEGGGHGQPLVGTLPLLTALLDRVPVPVLAGGGIGSARGLAAVLAAGASAAWLGTAFCACTESLLSDKARDTMLAAGDTDTVNTRVFDIAQGYPWPPSLPERVLRNSFSDRWDGDEESLSVDSGAAAALARAIAAEDYTQAPINAGQGVGELTAVRSAAEVIGQLNSGVAELLSRWATRD
ncbi:nitronate monooxygenase [Mycobacterium sp. CVI_P3]|uniref:Nitronate monooxygenase n=1 Tax=Mycobacterium pinniadriaticum TaxID=2994102 RepID=A0ABT3SHQ6_9MYCO|nr:nitronate monooxygenase [Mycobacterium pinniadriaticum]MCX2932627.1 nitronate monooxygenase [Mycobacterium pinniadriaticum]MCX2939051.1 nitronate monooxygenase [Mycobacterium pinniadriaticum]